MYFRAHSKSGFFYFLAVYREVTRRRVSSVAADSYIASGDTTAPFSLCSLGFALSYLFFRYVYVFI